MILLAGVTSLEFYRFHQLHPSEVEDKQSQHPKEVKPTERQKHYPMLAGARPSCSQDSPVSLENIENYNWTYCSFDLRPFWRDLRIPVGRFTKSSSLFEASSTYGDIDGDKVDERFLHLRIDGGNVARIVVLKRSPQGYGGWRSLTFLDLSTFHLDPEARVVTNGRGRWMAVSHIEKSWGAGIFQDNETWYALTDPGFREVLSFPIEGHVDVAGIPPIELTFKTTIDMSRFDGLRDTVNVQYVTTLAGFEDVPIRRTVGFSKEPSSSKFGFDKTASTVSIDEFLAIYNIDSGKFTEQQFLNFAHETLRVIAPRDNSSREWLSNLLRSCDATTQNVCPDFIKLLER